MKMVKEYTDAGKLYLGVIGQWDLYTGHVMPNVGGIYLNNTVFFGNKKKAYEAVPAEIQRRAVDYLVKNAINLPEWLFFNPITEKRIRLRIHQWDHSSRHHIPWQEECSMQISILCLWMTDC